MPGSKDLSSKEMVEAVAPRIIQIRMKLSFSVLKETVGFELLSSENRAWTSPLSGPLTNPGPVLCFLQE